MILVDEEFKYLLEKYKWRANSRGYVVRNHHYYDESGKRHTKTILLHREIMNAQEGQEVDHINHNTLDNRKSNLRLCTSQQNKQNARSHKDSNSKYRGVCYKANNSQNKWESRIQSNGKRIIIGYYSTEKEAAKAYNEKAIELHGQFACLNEV